MGCRANAGNELFTGIVQLYALVTAIDDRVDLRRLQIDMSGMVEGLAAGASVAVNGTCLTVTHIVTATDSTLVWFDVIKETIDTTNLGALAVGDRVNLERSYRVGDEIGGHILSGHIAAQVPLVDIQQSDNLRNLWFAIPKQWLRYVLHKGFVALDGASLTVSDLDLVTGRIAVSLIPETIERTSLGRVALGDSVNLELDSQTQGVVATVERLFADPDWRARLLPGA